MKKGLAIGFGIFGTIVLVLGAFVFLFIRSYISSFKWEIHEPMTSEQQDRFSNMALYPELAPCFERYAVKGMRDAKYLVETYQYNGLDEMYEALPETCRNPVEESLSNITPKEGEDMKGVPVKIYDISYGLPLLDEDTAPEEYKVYTYNAFHDYYVYEYEDGTYRFATVISTV